MFLHLSVILFTEGDLSHCMLGYTPQDQSRRLLLRTVRVLLECILVLFDLWLLLLSLLYKHTDWKQCNRLEVMLLSLSL